VPTSQPDAREAPNQPEFLAVALEPITPELALVDPDLGARARAALPLPVPAPLKPLGAISPSPLPELVETASHSRARPYPLWARVTAALWLLVIGVLIGGAAIPHAEDQPRVIPNVDNPPAACQAPQSRPTPPTRFGFP
jgi:hypothetical protein